MNAATIISPEELRARSPAAADLPEPDALRGFGETLPDVLLPYQRELLVAITENDVVLEEKSRRIGQTWGIGAGASLTAASRKSAGGQNVFYIGYKEDLALEFIAVCAMWSRAFLPAAFDVQEFLFDDVVDGDTRQIKAFRITYASSFSVVALSSRPRNLRGMQGFVIFDEAAFHEAFDEMLKAALALLIWGGKLLIISTHNGVGNPFNQLILECRAGKRAWPVLRHTFDDAVKQGLYRRVCLTKGKPWSQEEEDAWVAKIRKDYGEHAAEELDCVPRSSGGKYLARTTLYARATGGPVLFLSLPATWVDLPEDRRIREIEEWCRDHLAPAIARVVGQRSFVGGDFGRSGDLSCFWPLIESGTDLLTPFTIELQRVPFRAQEQILFFLLSHLPRFSGAALDARGNGQYLAEVARQRFGPELVDEVMLSIAWYRDHMPKMRAALEDGVMTITNDPEVIDDLASLEVVDGVARPPETARKTETRGQRHADSAIAACMALCARNTINAGGPIGVTVSSSTSLRGLSGARAGISRTLAAWKL